MQCIQIAGAIDINNTVVGYVIATRWRGNVAVAVMLLNGQRRLP